MSTPATAHADLEARFAFFLGLLDDPYAGKALHACYAAEARLAFKEDVVAAGEVGADAYAMGLAIAAMVHDELRPGVVRRPVLRDPVLVELAEEPDGRRVAWYRATEAEEGQAVRIAVGYLREPDGAWRIGWLTLAPAIAAWSYAEGLVQALADFPFMVAAGLTVPRSWLDLAWHRLHGHPRPALSFLPEARFACHGSGACCVKGFATDIPAGAQALVDAIPWERHAPHLAGTRFERVDEVRVRLKQPDEDCRFLAADGRCRIHAIVGRSVFPACTSYPMSFQPTPEGVAVATSPACPSARANLGPPLADRTADLYMRLAMLGATPVPPFRLEQDGEPDWEGYKAAEAALLALLDRADLPLARRLWLGSRWLDHAAEGVVPTPAVLEAEPAPTTHDPDGRRADLLAGFAAHVGLAAPDDAASDDVPPDDARPGPARPLPAAAEATLAGVLRNHLHAKTIAGKHGLRFAHHMGVLAYVLACWAAARHPSGTPPERVFWQLGAALAHGKLRQAIEAQPELLAAVADPAFGAWLLGDPPPA